MYIPDRCFNDDPSRKKELLYIDKETNLPVYGKWSVFALIFLAGIYAAERYSNITGIEDPGSVVIDEVAGLLLFYIIFPFKPVYIIAGFILFRFFDILKPFPVSFFDSIKNLTGAGNNDFYPYAEGACFGGIRHLIVSSSSRITFGFQPFLLSWSSSIKIRLYF